MRLTQEEQRAIVQTVKEVLPTAKVMLYGSRTDDSKRGGDIDLMILDASAHPRMAADEIRWKLWEKIGEQKIDILLEQVGKLSTFGEMVMHDAIPIGE